MSVIDYQKSIGAELKSLQDRVRNLIGSANWGEEGRYKEAVLRAVLRRMLPFNLSIGTGFIIESNLISKQIDIIIWDNTHPIAFSDGDFVIVPPECVKGIIEVKTRLSSANIDDAITNAVVNGKLLVKDTFNGIFAYDSDLVTCSGISTKLRSSLGLSLGIVNHFALGQNYFVKFWDNTRIFNSNESPAASEYSIYKLQDLSFSYFLSNVISEVSKEKGKILDWFLYPIPEGKEMYKIDEVTFR